MHAAELAAAGLVTCFGRGVVRSWDALLAGRCGFVSRAFRDGSRAALVAPVPEEVLPWEAHGEDRALALVRLAVEELAGAPALEAVRPSRLGVAVGSTQGTIRAWEEGQRRGADPRYRPALPHPSEPALEVARRLGAAGPLANPSMACASGAAAVGLGLSWLRRGECDAVVVGGVDALSGFVHAGFSALRALDSGAPRPFDAARAGLGLGEAAVLLVLRPAREGSETRVTGYGCAADAHHLTGPDPAGGGARRAMQAALADARLPADAVDLVSAHGTGTPYNDLMESQALAGLFGPTVGTRPVHSVKGAFGHTLAAAGALEALVCDLALREGLFPATVGLERLDPAIALDVVRGAPRRGDFRAALSLSAGFGGINAALVLERPRA
ncbi:MAG: beta-ketoacyl-[acyl-carrier-protein] synthase family protein [Deltaproteobacteria bacterium]|nr:beta-ketoacyl-[acyl-carrier-protein] synthase family protein [Deltaproteobacteria bacterium]